MDPKASWTPGKYWIDQNISTSPKFGSVDTFLGEKEIPQPHDVIKFLSIS